MREAIARWMHMTLLALTAADSIEGVDGGGVDLVAEPWGVADGSYQAITSFSYTQPKG